MQFLSIDLVCSLNFEHPFDPETQTAVRLETLRRNSLQIARFHAETYFVSDQAGARDTV